jgi:hypothetical protein
MLGYILQPVLSTCLQTSRTKRSSAFCSAASSTVDGGRDNPTLVWAVEGPDPRDGKSTSVSADGAVRCELG